MYTGTCNQCCCREKKSMSTCRIKNNSDIDNVDMKSVFGTVPPSPSIIHATHTIHDNHVESTVKASMTVPVRSLTLTQMMSTHYRLTSGKYISTNLKRIQFYFFLNLIHILFWRIKFLYHENESVCPALAPVKKARKRCSSTLGANLRITNCNSDHC